MAKVLNLRSTTCDVVFENQVSLDEWDSLQEEYEFPGKKCGEVLLGENESFWFNCTLCHERFLNVAKFCYHVKEVHISHQTDELVDPLDEKNSIKIEETNQSQSPYSEMENDNEEISSDSDIKDPGSLSVVPPSTDSREKESNLLKTQILKRVKRSPTKKTRKRTVHSCEHCDRKLIDRRELAVHMRVHTGEKPYQCEECGKFFRFLPALNSHLIVHAGTRPYKCSICGAGFAHPGSLRTHSFRHTGEKPHKCTHCDKAFVSTSSLKVHMRHHAVEMPFICNFCGEGFPFKWQYDKHMKRETNQRDFRCETCGKAFFNKYTLSTHMACHSNEKEFECDVCQGRFNRRSTLKEHQKLHIATKQHICDICNKEYAQAAGLHSHMKHHKRESVGDVE